MDATDCIVQGLWRILGSVAYRDKFFCTKDLAKLFNSEYGLTESSALQWRRVQSAVQRYQPKLGVCGSDTKDTYSIPWRDGIHSKPAHMRGTPEPIQVKRAVVTVNNKGGNSVMVLGWCKDGVGQVVAINQVQPDPKLRIAEVDKTNMAWQLSGNGGNNGSSNSNEEREPSNNAGGGSNRGGDTGRTPPPPPSRPRSSAATTTRRVSPPTAGNGYGTSEDVGSRKRQREDEEGSSMETKAAFPSNFINFDGRFFEVPDSAVPSLLDFIKAESCDEFRLPGNSNEDDLPAIVMSIGQPTAPKYTKVEFQTVGNGS